MDSFKVNCENCTSEITKHAIGKNSVACPFCYTVVNEFGQVQALNINNNSEVEAEEFDYAEAA